jgi:hypothetical protein
MWNNMMRNFIGLIVILTLISCQRDLPTTHIDRIAPVVKVHSLPVLLNPGKTYTIAVSVESASGVGSVDSVGLNVFKIGATVPIFHSALFDDGSYLDPDDGDVVAHDGFYTQKILWTVSEKSNQSYIFNFIATDKNGTESRAVEDTLVSLNNIAPHIVGVTMPDTLPSGFKGTKLFEVSVTDSNGVQDIQGVSFKIVQNNKVILQAPLGPQLSPIQYPADVVAFSMLADSSFSAGMKGLYEIHFIASDISEDVSEPVIRNLYMENSEPMLHDLSTVSQIKRPESGIITFYVTVGVRDPQSVKDIKSVRMTWLKPDGTYSTNSPFELYDNGLPFDLNPSMWNAGYRGDKIAGDNYYSITAIFDQNQPLGDYILTFEAQDRAGNKSSALSHIVNLY